MIVGKKYTLNCSPDRFLDLTGRREFLYHLTKNGDVCSPKSVSDSVAEFSFETCPSDVTFEIPSEYWNLFQLYEEVQPEIRLATSDEIRAENMDKLTAIKNSNKNMLSWRAEPGSYYTATARQINPNKLTFDSNYALTFESITIAAPTFDMGYIVDFILTNVHNGRYVIDTECDVKSQREQVCKLAGLHESIRAVEHLEEMLEKEKASLKEQIQQFLPKTAKKNEDRNLRNTRKSS